MGSNRLTFVSATSFHTSFLEGNLTILRSVGGNRKTPFSLYKAFAIPTPGGSQKVTRIALGAFPQINCAEHCHSLVAMASILTEKFLVTTPSPTRPVSSRPLAENYDIYILAKSLQPQSAGTVVGNCPVFRLSDLDNMPPSPDLGRVYGALMVVRGVVHV